MRFPFLSALLPALVLAVAVPAIAHADYYNPPRNKQYLKGFDGPGSTQSQVPFGFDESRDQDKAAIIHPTGVPGVTVINKVDRDRIGGYVRSNYRGDCPTGTKRIGRACETEGKSLPYVIGQPLPTTIVVEPAPAELVTTLQPLPQTHTYVQYGSDVLLIDRTNNIVIDSVISR